MEELQKEIEELTDDLERQTTWRDRCMERQQGLDLTESSIDAKNYTNACNAIKRIRFRIEQIRTIQNHCNAFQKDPSSLLASLISYRDLWVTPNSPDVSLIEGGASDYIVDSIRLLHLCKISPPEIGDHPHIHRFKENEPLPQMWQQWINIFNKLIKAVKTHLDSNQNNPEVGDKDDTKTDTPKKKKKNRDFSAKHLACVDIYKRERAEDPRFTLRNAVQEYVDEHPGESFDSIYRTLNDHPDMWKNDT